MNDDPTVGMIEVVLNNDDDFLKIMETLERIGVASYKNKTLYQSCHILHKRGKFYIVHFKELFKLDGKPSSMTKEDVSRRNTIADLLEEWELLTIVNKDLLEDNFLPLKKIKILPYKEKDQWNLVTKYNLGKK
jgi:hypothetical protein